MFSRGVECKQRLMGLTDDIRVCNEYAIASISFALLASYFSSNSGRKVTKRTPPDQFALRVPEAFTFAYGPS